MCYIIIINEMYMRTAQNMVKGLKIVEEAASAQIHDGSACVLFLWPYEQTF